MRRKPNLASALGIQKENWGVAVHFSEIIKLQFGNEHNTVLCILKLLTNILDQLSLNLNAWFPSIFFLDFYNTC